MKRGRPAKNADDKVKNQLIAIDIEDYRRIKIHAIKSSTPIKVIVHRLVDNLDRIA